MLESQYVHLSLPLQIKFCIKTTRWVALLGNNEEQNIIKLPHSNAIHL